MSAGKKGRVNSYGNIGATSLRVKPDLRREKRGLFEKEYKEYNKEYVKPVPNENLILAKKYYEIDKENHRKKLRRGLTDENYRADKAWRPGGAAIASHKGASR